MKDFFISYNKADKEWAEWIAWQLEEAKYTTVLQAWDFRPGSNFVLEMQKAASEAKCTIAVLSQSYIDAEFTQPEWAAAFAQDPKGEDRKLVLVRVRECEPKGLLAPIVYIDLVDLPETAAKDALLAGVKLERAKPKAETAKLPGVTLQRLRPTFGSLYLQQGVSLSKIALWMGHSSEDVPRRHYAALTTYDDDIEKVGL